MDFKNFWIFFTFFVLASCSLYKTPDLPDVNRKSFSYEDVVKRKNDLVARRAEESQAKEINREINNEQQRQQ